MMPSPRLSSIEELSALLSNPIPFPSKLTKNLQGQMFGRLLCLQYAGVNDGHSNWVCLCSCPEKNLVKIKAHNLINGLAKSCGCISRERAEKKRKVIQDGIERPWKLKKIPPFMTKEEYYSSSSGFKDNIPGFFYIQSVCDKDGSRFFKVGISNDWPQRRTARINQRSPYNHKLLHWWCFQNGLVAKQVESVIKQEFKHTYSAKKKFDGYTETVPEEALSKVLSYIKNYSSLLNSNWVDKSCYEQSIEDNFAQDDLGLKNHI